MTDDHSPASTTNSGLNHQGLKKPQKDILKFKGGFTYYVTC